MSGAPSTSLRLVAGAALCLLAGAAFGSWWSAPPERLWHDRPAAAPETAPLLPSFRDVVEQVGPAVVTVRATLPDEVAPPGEPLAAPDAAAPAADADPTLVPSAANPVFAPRPGHRNGPGFVVHERGLVLTSRHVVLGASAIEVLSPQHGRLAADLVGEDPATDLALLRLVSPPPGLPALALGSSEDLRAGDWIVAVGNPFGFSRTVTAGVVSFVGRHLQHSDFGVTSDFLQISAPINPGSSGCPVLDVRGRVVGVTTQVAAAAQGISFAVPSRAVKWALEQMRRRPDGRVRRGYLGIEFASRSGLDERGAPRPGAVIVRVADGDPAHRAGLREGDVVLGVDGTPVRDAKELHERIVCSDPGTPIALQLLRDGRIEDPVVAVLGEIGGGGEAPF